VATSSILNTNPLTPPMVSLRIATGGVAVCQTPRAGGLQLGPSVSSEELGILLVRARSPRARSGVAAADCGRARLATDASSRQRWVTSMQGPELAVPLLRYVHRLDQGFPAPSWALTFRSRSVATKSSSSSTLGEKRRDLMASGPSFGIREGMFRLGAFAGSRDSGSSAVFGCYLAEKRRRLLLNHSRGVTTDGVVRRSRPSSNNNARPKQFGRLPAGCSGFCWMHRRARGCEHIPFAVWTNGTWFTPHQFVYRTAGHALGTVEPFNGTHSTTCSASTSCRVVGLARGLAINRKKNKKASCVSRPAPR